MNKILEEARREATLFVVVELEKYLSATPFGEVAYCYALAKKILLQDPQVEEIKVLNLIELDCGVRFGSLDELYEAKNTAVPLLWY